MMNAFNVLTELWIPHLWAVSWQVSILIVIIWIVDKLSFRATSLFRYLLWLVVLFRLCIPLNLTLPGGMAEHIRNRVGIGIPEIHKIMPELTPFQDISNSFLFENLPLAPIEELPKNNETITSVEKQISITLYNFAGILWFTVIFLIGIFILRRVLWIHKRLKECPPVVRPDLCALFTRLKKELKIRHTVGLNYIDIDNIDVPAVIGVIDPRIFLPHKIADKWSIADIEPILLHELAHVKRFDLIINWLQVIIQIVYFFHPLVWFANRRIRQVREELCDDIAVNGLSAGRKRYTLSIIRVMEETLKEPAFGFIGIGFTERKSSLNKRIKRIMSDRYKSDTKMTVLSLVFLIIIGTTGIFLSCGHSALKKSNSETYSVENNESYSAEIDAQDTALLKKAKEYLSSMEYDTAISYYKKFIAEFPESELVDKAWCEMGMCMQGKGDELGAVESLLNVSRKDKILFTTARYLSARILYQERRDSEVIDVLTYAIEDTSAVNNLFRLSQFYIMRGNAYRRLENFETAIADYTNAYNLNQPVIKEIASDLLAGVNIDQTPFTKTENYLMELINKEEENKEYDIPLYISSFVTASDTEPAIQRNLDQYNSAKDIDEKILCLRNLIQTLRGSGNLDRLLKYATIMIEFDDAEVKKHDILEFYKEETYHHLASAIEAQGLFSEDKTFDNPAATPESQRYYTTAVDYYIEGYERFPYSFNSAVMLMKIGILYLTKLPSIENSRSLAAEYLQEYIKKFPDTRDTEMVNFYLGYSHYTNRKFKEAIDIFREFTGKYPDSEFIPEALFYYSDGLYNIGKLGDSIEGFDSLIERYPGHEKVPEAIYTKGWANLDLEKEEEAISAFQIIVDRFPESDFAHRVLFTIGDYYYRTKRYEEARKYYEIFLEEYPDSPFAEKAREQLKLFSP